MHTSKDSDISSIPAALLFDEICCYSLISCRTGTNSEKHAVDSSALHGGTVFRNDIIQKSSNLQCVFFRVLSFVKGSPLKYKNSVLISKA